MPYTNSQSCYPYTIYPYRDYYGWGYSTLTYENNCNRYKKKYRELKNKLEELEYQSKCEDLEKRIAEIEKKLKNKK